MVSGNDETVIFNDDNSNLLFIQLYRSVNALSMTAVVAVANHLWQSKFKPTCNIKVLTDNSTLTY